MRTETGFCISTGFYLYWAVLLLLLPLQCILALLVSTAVHELGHVAALRVLKVPVNSVRLGPSGVQLHTPPVAPWKELICAAAGPVSGFCLLFAARQFPLLALFSVLQSLYNLLPIYPGDGGRICNSICLMLFSGEIAEKAVKILGISAALLIAFLGFYGSVAFRLGLIPCIWGTVVAINAIKNQK